MCPWSINEYDLQEDMRYEGNEEWWAQHYMDPSPDWNARGNEDVVRALKMMKYVEKWGQRMYSFPFFPNTQTHTYPHTHTA